jgi:hypothetical protein
MKSIFQWAFAIVSMVAFYICNGLYIASHVVFNGNLKYDPNFISCDYVQFEETESDIVIWTYTSMAHKWLGIAKSQRRIPKQ